MLKSKFPNMNIRDRLLLYSHVNSFGCWEWQGTKFKNTGYGQITYKGKIISAHRLSAHVFKNFDLQSKLLILHKCDNKVCINPGHIYTGTREQNLKDAIDRYRLRRGSKHHKAKLTEGDVELILGRIKDGFTTKAIADYWQVSKDTITKIKRGISWTHVKRSQDAKSK